MSHGRRRLQTEPCVVLYKTISMEDGSEIEEVDCYDATSDYYSHIGDKNVEASILEKLKNGNLISGESTLMQEGAYFDEDEAALIVDEYADLEFGRRKNSQSRRKLAVTGTKSMLALRVVAPDSATSATESQISNAWYGTNGDPLNLKSQYEACSYGKVTMNPANTNQVSNGVYTVNIAQTATGVDNSLIRSAAVNEGNAQLGNMQSQFDFVMVCVPPGTNGGWIAYAYGNWYLSVVRSLIIACVGFVIFLAFSSTKLFIFSELSTTIIGAYT